MSDLGLSIYAVSKRIDDNLLKPEFTTTCYERIRKWVNGDNAVPLEWIPGLCEALSCDIGYLVGDYFEPIAALSIVANVMGLNEQSVSVLATFNDSKDMPCLGCSTQIWNMSRMTLSDKVRIEAGIYGRLRLNEGAQDLEKGPKYVSQAIKRNRAQEPSYHPCPVVAKPSYVCNV